MDTEQEQRLLGDMTSAIDELQKGLDSVKATMDYWIKPKEEKEEKLKPPFQYSFSVTASSCDDSHFTEPTDWYIEVTANDSDEAEGKAYDAIKNMSRDVELEQILKEGIEVDASEIEEDQ